LRNNDFTKQKGYITILKMHLAVKTDITIKENPSLQSTLQHNPFECPISLKKSDPKTYLPGNPNSKQHGILYIGRGCLKNHEIKTQMDCMLTRTKVGV
jgi:hypothetical protein